MTEEAGVWVRCGVIETPAGVYTPETDDLKVELNKAAEFARLGNFRVKISDTYINSPSNLPTNSIAALLDGIAIEQVGDVCVASVAREDKAA